MIFILAVCSALLMAGAALKCDVCYAMNSNSCVGKSELCQSPESRCMMTLTETSLKDGEEMKSSILEKTCGSVYDCIHPATLTTNEYRVQVTRKCCNEDSCNNGTMELKQLNSSLNGMNCPSCFAKNSQTCDKENHVDCKGDERHCVQYLVSREGGGTITVAGCASESMERSHGVTAFRGSRVTIRDMMNGNGGKSLRCNPVLLPFVAMLTILSKYSQ